MEHSRATRLAATPGERKRYSPAKTLHPKAGGQSAGAGTAPGGEGSAPSTPDPARPAPPFSSLFAQLLGFSFGFGPASVWMSPEGICSHSDRTGLK